MDKRSCVLRNLMGIFGKGTGINYRVIRIVIDIGYQEQKSDAHQALWPPGR